MHAREKPAGAGGSEHQARHLDADLDYKSPAALSMMRAIKHALDPYNLFNPGRVLHG